MRTVVFLILVLLSYTSYSQKGFPDPFVGHWKGEIEWYRPGVDTAKKFKMQLIIQPADSANHYTWKIVYGERGEYTRPYMLKPVDPAKGHWMVDEQNGILLDQYWIGPKFYSVFSVGGMTIVNSYWREGAQLLVEFASFPSKSVRTSGAGTEESPTVESYHVRSYQKGILSRVE